MHSVETEGQAALAALDRALAAMPKKEQLDFGLATEHLCAMRNGLIAESRSGLDRSHQMDRLNAIISCNLSGLFPLGAIPWPTIVSARVSLQGLLAEVAASEVERKTP